MFQSDILDITLFLWYYSSGVPTITVWVWPIGFGPLGLAHFFAQECISTHLLGMFLGHHHTVIRQDVPVFIYMHVLSGASLIWPRPPAKMVAHMAVIRTSHSVLIQTHTPFPLFVPFPVVLSLFGICFLFLSNQMQSKPFSPNVWLFPCLNWFPGLL